MMRCLAGDGSEPGDASEAEGVEGDLEMSGTRGDDCPVTVSWSDSPDGPWTPVGRVVVPYGPDGTWDQYSIHDPHPQLEQMAREELAKQAACSQFTIPP